MWLSKTIFTRKYEYTVMCTRIMDSDSFAVNKQFMYLHRHLQKAKYNIGFKKCMLNSFFKEI